MCLVSQSFVTEYPCNHVAEKKKVKEKVAQ